MRSWLSLAMISLADRVVSPMGNLLMYKETKEKIKYDDYKKLSDDEKEQYNVYPKMQVFRVFNVAQTNLQEARPELWQKPVSYTHLQVAHPVQRFSAEDAGQPRSRALGW